MVDRLLENLTASLACWSDDGSQVASTHRSWELFKSVLRGQAIAYGAERRRRLDGQFSTKLVQLRHLHASPPSQPDAAAEVGAWIQKVTELEGDVIASVRSRLEGRRIRSRTRWTEEGERSTRYFFRCMKGRSQFTWLRELRDDNQQTVSDTPRILSIVRGFYERLFGHVDTVAASQDELLQHVTKRVDEELRATLEDDITDDEVMEAIRKSPHNSAPGPDGISYELYKSFAAQLAPILARLFNESRKAGRFPLSFRRTHIVLLPKAGDLLSLANWRPISLSDCDIKLLTRVLVSRMQRAAQWCIEESQTGFIKTRSIFDNIHALHFALQYGVIKPEEVSGAIMLLDQQKAYDRVDWTYMDRCLERFGIGPGFRQWLQMLGDGASAAVRIGPVCSHWIPIRKGLRQGDPLSPLLYNFVLEPLLCLLRGRLAGLSLPGYALRTLAFADDIAVAVSSSEDVQVFRRAIQLHENASAAKLNEQKTVLIPVGRPEFDLPFPALGGREHTRYLGISFTCRGLEVEAMERRLLNDINTTADHWQDRQLSIAGRVLLTNSCLLAKLWFAAHVVPFSEAFIGQVMARVKRFIWNSKRNRVAEVDITRSKAEGGLGLLPLKAQALAIFGTWVARMLSEDRRPAWAPVAQSMLAHHLAAVQRHPAMLCAQRTARKANPFDKSLAFWHRMMEFWKDAKGKCLPVDSHWHPLEVLALPMVGGIATTTIGLPRTRELSWQRCGAHTLGDVLHWDAVQGKYVTRDSPSARCVTFDHGKHRWGLRTEVVKRLLPLERAPLSGPPFIPFARCDG